MPRCGFFHAMDRYLEYTRDRDTLRLLLPKTRHDRRPPHCRDSILDWSRRTRRTSFAGRSWVRAHMDGRKSGRSRRDPSEGKGGRNQRALVQRTLPSRRMAGVGKGNRGGPAVPRTRQTNGRILQSSILERKPAAIFTTSSMASTATTLPFGRTRSLPSLYGMPCSNRRGGGPWSTRSGPAWPHLLASDRSLLTIPNTTPKYFGDLRARDLAYHQGRSGHGS